MYYLLNEVRRSSKNILKTKQLVNKTACVVAKKKHFGTGWKNKTKNSLCFCTFSILNYTNIRFPLFEKPNPHQRPEILSRNFFLKKTKVMLDKEHIFCIYLKIYIH